MDKLQQIKQILDNAPPDASHIDQEGYFIKFEHGTYFCAPKFGAWRVMQKIEFTRTRELSDLRTQLALIEENEKLKAQIKGSAWTRVEEVDYKPHHICNFCHNDLNVEDHESDCVIKELSND